MNDYREWPTTGATILYIKVIKVVPVTKLA